MEVQETPALAVSSEIEIEENGFSLMSRKSAITMHSRENKLRWFLFSMLHNPSFLLLFARIELKINVFTDTLCNI